MILYALACADGHRFESWFRASADFDDQAARGLVSCPFCNSTDVSKSIMAPAVVTRKAAGKAEEQPAAPAPAPSVPAVAPPVANMALLDGEMRERLKAFRAQMMQASEDVGSHFPEQARRMHEGDIPQRQIRGEATLDEARSLLEDGVPILPIPTLPDELN